MRALAQEIFKEAVCEECGSARTADAALHEVRKRFLWRCADGTGVRARYIMRHDFHLRYAAHVGTCAQEVVAVNESRAAAMCAVINSDRSDKIQRCVVAKDAINVRGARATADSVVLADAYGIVRIFARVKDAVEHDLGARVRNGKRDVYAAIRKDESVRSRCCDVCSEWRHRGKCFSRYCFPSPY